MHAAVLLIREVLAADNLAWTKNSLIDDDTIARLLRAGDGSDGQQQ